MKEFYSLVMLQLKDKLNFSFLRSKKETIFKVVFAILKVGIITALITVGFWLLSFLRLFSLLPGISTELFNLIFSIMMTLSIIVSVKGLVQSLYLAKDNFVLLTLPMSREKIFLSKFVVYYIYEFIRNLTYLMPMMIGYFLVNGCALYYYLWLIPILLIYTFIILSISALLSIPTLFVVNFIKKRQWLELSILLGLIGIAVYVIVKLILLIPENFDLRANWGTTFWAIQDFLTAYADKTWIFKTVLTALVGIRYGVSNQLFTSAQWSSLGLVLGGTIGIMVITYVLVRPLFFRMASSGFEHKKDNNKKKGANTQLAVRSSLLKKELLLTYRNSDKFYPLILTALFLPLSILLLNKIYGAMQTRVAGTHMTIAFNVLMILLIALSSSAILAKAISQEGPSAYVNKITPQSYTTMLTSKMTVHFIVFTLSILAATIIFGSFSGMKGLDYLAIFLFVETIYISHALYSLELDIMNPQTQEYSTTGNHSNNKNETKSSLMAMLLSVLFALLTYLFIGENPAIIWWKLAFIGGLYLAWRIYLYTSKIKVFYKEK